MCLVSTAVSAQDDQEATDAQAEQRRARIEELHQLTQEEREQRRVERQRQIDSLTDEQRQALRERRRLREAQSTRRQGQRPPRRPAAQASPPVVEDAEQE